jgi:hypothetical protein
VSLTTFKSSLREGILLEDSKQILPWGCDRAKAWTVGNPARYLPDGDTSIKWEERMLSSLPCGLLAWLPDGAQLDHVSLWLRLFLKIPILRVLYSDIADFSNISLKR